MATICPVTNENCPYKKILINGICEDQLTCPVVDLSYRAISNKNRKIFNRKTLLISFYAFLLLLLASFTYLYFFTNLIRTTSTVETSPTTSIPPIMSINPDNQYTVLINNEEASSEQENNTITLHEIDITNNIATAPRRISIPALSVYAEIKNVTLNKYNLIEAYPSKDIVSWYEQSALPGEIGNCILMGNHYFQNFAAVFSNLDSIKKGDQITFTYDNGLKTTLSVYEIIYYKGDILPKDILNLSSGFAKTTIISRGGQLDPETADYDSFIVILAN